MHCIVVRGRLCHGHKHTDVLIAILRTRGKVTTTCPTANHYSTRHNVNDYLYSTYSQILKYTARIC